jgi:hypothetical protein
MRSHIRLGVAALGFVLTAAASAFSQDRFFDSSGVRTRYVE